MESSQAQMPANSYDKEMAVEEIQRKKAKLAEMQAAPKATPEAGEGSEHRAGDVQRQDVFGTADLGLWRCGRW